ncbi:hypothetical protein D3Z50_02685 [Clostridiaceae bacterium]|nr:hypothetical protein [Clostridiaceae bacterium]
MYQPSPEVFGVALFCVLPFMFTSAIMDLKLWISSRVWHGRVISTVEEVKKDYHLELRPYRKKWFEFPVITYRVGDTVYKKECPGSERAVGFYTAGQQIPILYNEQSPEECMFEGQFSSIGSRIWLFVYPFICLLTLILAVDCCAEDAFNSHETRYEGLYGEKTWRDLAFSFDGGTNGCDYSGWNSDDACSLERNIREAILHFRRINEKTEKKLGKRSYRKYRDKYEEAAICASRKLADIYSQCISQFLVRCGLDGEETRIWRSAYSEFLRQICPDAAPDAGVYSMEELTFMMRIVSAARDYDFKKRSDPEESIGLFLAASCAGLHHTADILSFEPSIKEKILRGFDGFLPRYIEDVNEYLKCVPRLEPEPVYAVYSYTVKRYLDTGSFETALWDGSVFAHEQLLSRLQEHPDLEKTARFQDNRNPFSDFNPEAGSKYYFHHTTQYGKDSPPYLYHAWENNLEFYLERHKEFFEGWRQRK